MSMTRRLITILTLVVGSVSVLVGQSVPSAPKNLRFASDISGPISSGRAHEFFETLTGRPS